MSPLLRSLIVMATTVLSLAIGATAVVVLAGVVFPLSADGPIGDCELRGPTSGWADERGCPISQEEYARWEESNRTGRPSWVLLLFGLTFIGFGMAGGVLAFVVTGRVGRRSDQPARAG